MLTRRVTGLNGLRLLREPWLSLHAGADLYARFEWHLACAMHLLGDASLTYVQVLDGDRTVAIVPAIASHEPFWPFGHLRVLSFGLHTHLSLADIPLAVDVRAEDVAAALGAALAAWPERWDVLRWPRVLASSNAMCLVRAFDAFAVQMVTTSPCNTLDTRQPFPELLASLSKNLRASLRKSQKRLEGSGDVHMTCNGVRADATSGSQPRAPYSGADSIDAAYDAFLAIEASGWKGEAGTGSAIRLNSDTRGFYAELLALRGADFVPEVTLLARGSTPIAAQFSVTVNRCKHVLKIGYQEAESHFSPGQLLMAKVLEAACGGMIECVNVVTDMAWHKAWRPTPQPTFGVIVFRSPWRAALYYGYSWARRSVKMALLAFRRLFARPGELL